MGTSVSLLVDTPGPAKHQEAIITVGTAIEAVSLTGSGILYDTRYMPAVPRPFTLPSRAGFLLATLIVMVASLRLTHVHLLWADEDYHLAAALQMLHGKLPYRDFWYDKPPLAALYYLANAATSGWPLRLLDAGYILLACRLIFLLGLHWWGRSEGYLAAFLLAFFTSFYLPSAVIPFAADALMLVPHLAAVYCASLHWPIRCGLCCALAFLANTKALFVLVTCLLWCPGSALALGLATGFPLALLACLALPGRIFEPYWQQVWHWGAWYARGSPVLHPVSNGLLRSANWLGFHSLLMAGSVKALAQAGRRDRFRLSSWIALSFAATALGSRFAPHYFLQLLPSLVLCGARGSLLLWERFRSKRWLAASIFSLLLAIPLLRFGPRYVSLLGDDIAGRMPTWSDVKMDEDSQEAARLIGKHSIPSDSLFVWGYRPDLYVWTRLVPDGLFSDSQPLTGVPADRHLEGTSTIVAAGWTAANRRTLAASHPTFIADGLSPFNPELAMDRYGELRPWLAHYRICERTALTVIYKRRDDDR